MKKTTVVLVLALAVAGCRWESDAEERFVSAVERARAETENPYGLRIHPAQPPVESAAPAPDDSDPDSLVVSGRIAETMDAGSYTYLRVKTASGDVWAAVPQIELHVGDPVVVNGELTMENFASKRLKRTFEKIIFGTIAGTHPLPEIPATATNINFA